MENKKQKNIIIFLMVILIIGTIIAGSVITINSNREIDKKYTDKIKEKTGVSKIEIVISQPSCNFEFCKFRALQEGIINTEFIIPTKYCSNYSDYSNSSNYSSELIPCFEYTNYTPQEIRKLADDYIEERIIDYAKALEQRDRIREDKEIGGKITFNKK